MEQLATFEEKCKFLDIYSLSDVFLNPKYGELKEYWSDDTSMMSVTLSLCTSIPLARKPIEIIAHLFEYNRDLLKNLIDLEAKTRDSFLTIGKEDFIGKEQKEENIIDEDVKEQTEFSNEIFTKANYYSPLPPIIAIYEGGFNNYDFIHF